MKFQLQAERRDVATRGGRSQLRAEAKVLAQMYGHGMKNQNITVQYRDFEKLYREAGTSSIVELQIGKDAVPIQTLIAEIQRDPLTDRFIHVDFKEIKRDEKLRTTIKLLFVNEAPAVKELGGNLIINKDHLNIECLPKDLVSSIEMDLSVLKQIDQGLHIKDLIVPSGITVLDDPDDNVVSVLAPRIEQTPAEEAAEAAATEAEVAGEGKAEGAEQTAKDTTAENESDKKTKK